MKKRLQKKKFGANDKQSAVDYSVLPTSVGNILLKLLLLAMTSVGQSKRETRLHCPGRNQINALLETR